MKRRNVIGIFILLLMVGWSLEITNASDNPPATRPSGTITGIVIKDGEPVANARIGLIQRPAKVVAKGAKRNRVAPTTQNAPGTKRQRPTMLANTVTDAEGKFVLNDVPEGSYVIVAGSRGHSRAHERISVSAGTAATVTINLDAVPEKGAKAKRKLGL